MQLGEASAKRKIKNIFFVGVVGAKRTFLSRARVRAVDVL